MKNRAIWISVECGGQATCGEAVSATGQNEPQVGIVFEWAVDRTGQLPCGYDNAMTPTPIVGELMYEIDSLYVSTEMILSRRFREPPLDGLLLEACLLHFRVVWDFFYRPKEKKTDVVARDFAPTWAATDPPARLKRIRKWLNVMLAHLTTHRVDPDYKAGEITEDDIRLIREYTKTLFAAFFKAPLTKDQRDAMVNPLADKFTRYETLNR